jgi:hypothetical protein
MVADGGGEEGALWVLAALGCIRLMLTPVLDSVSSC